MGKYPRPLRPFLRFIKEEINSGYVLIMATIAAMILANTPAAELYFQLFEETKITIDFKIFSLSKPLYYWINDGLMAIFFLLIGLEVKREIIIGELRSFKKALFPIVAAVGGMVVPALVFILININNPLHINGWAIPMATDIAFALGILMLLKSKVPVELKIFLTSLAIVDDLGAVMSIAVFYTDDIQWIPLGISIGGWAALFLLNRLKVYHVWPYIVIGVLVVWYPMLLSGVHATIAGIMVALAIPIRRKFSTKEFDELTQRALNSFKLNSETDKASILDADQYAAVTDIQDYAVKVSSPLQRLEDRLHDFTLYFIMPLFAFANTGISLDTISFSEVVANPLSLGIFFGLALGKVLGISLFVFLFVKLKLIKIPESIHIKHLIGAGFLAGIGFTMSLFVTDLAFHGDLHIAVSKVAILAASVVSGVVGYLIIRSAPDPLKPAPNKTP